MCTSAGGQGRRCDDIADASLCVPRRVGGADYDNIDGTSVFSSGVGLVGYCDYSMILLYAILYTVLYYTVQ